MLMVGATVPEAWAASTIVDGRLWFYIVLNGKASLGDWNGSTPAVLPTSTSGSITIPSTLDGYPVTGIGTKSFFGFSGLTSVVIPDTVTNIGEHAFSGCSGLTGMTIPDSVKSIGEGAFFRCSGLESVTIPNSVTGIGAYAFEGCSGLSGVAIPDSVTSIGDWAFSGCFGLTSVLVSDGVQSIGRGAFSGCGGLERVTIPDSVKSIGSDAFSGCTNLNFDTTSIPAVRLVDRWVVGCESSLSGFVDLSTCRGVAGSAFRGCSGLTGVTIGEGVAGIGDSAFRGCNGLTSVTIPDSVESIGLWAFDGCSGLTNAAIGSGVKIIRDCAFYGCKRLMEIKVAEENPIYASRDGMLLSKNLAILICCPAGKSGTCTIPASVQNISTSYRYYAFAGCTKLTAFEVADGNEALASRDGVLFSKNMERLVCCPGGKTGVYSIPDGVTSIGNYAFSWCAGLKSVSVPATLQYVGSYAFYFCSGLETLFMPASWQGRLQNTARIRPGCRIIYGTRGAERLDGTAWQFFVQDGLSMVLAADGSGAIVVPAQLGECPVTGIAPHAFYGCEGGTEVVIPAGVTNIGNHAFSGCEGVVDVELPSGVTEIEDYAFSGCKGLTNVIIPDTVQRIGQHAFHGCTGLTRLTIGSGVAEIGQWAFAKCRGLSELVLPDGVARIGDFAFAGCDGLESVTIPASVTELGDHPFAGCKGLQEIAVEAGNGFYESQNGVLFSKGKTVLVGVPAGRGGVFVLPDEVEEIGVHAFDGCAALTALEVGEGNANLASRNGVLFSKDMSRLLACPAGKAGAVAVPAGVERIEDRAFANCNQLTSILIPESVTSMGAYSLARCDGLVALFVPEIWKDELALKGTQLPSGVKIFHGTLESETVGGVEWHFFAEESGAVVLPGDYGTEVVIPAELGGRPVTRIGEYAFYGCGELEKVRIPGSVTNVGDYAFYGCEGLVNVVLPDSVRSIGKWAFGGCKGLMSVAIPEGVESIGDRAFFGCSGLPEAAIPNSVENIGVNAFYGNSALTALEVGGENATYASQDGVLFSKEMDRLLWCPDGKTGDYVIPDGVKSLAYRAFGDCVGLTAGTMPESVEKIGRNAFYGCRRMAVLYVPASWEGVPELLEMLARAKLPEECLIVYLKDNPEETTSTTPVPVPFEWLEENAKAILDANGEDYDAAALTEAANGRLMWECYLMGLVPSDASAAFTVRLAFVDGAPVVQWNPDLNESGTKTEREYRVWGKKNIMDADWTDTTDVEDLEAEGWRFFRVGVEMAE